MGRKTREPVILKKVLKLADIWVHRLSSVTLLKHGLYWLTVSIVLDYSTSWTMMSLLGPESEGSEPTRTFFESRTVESLAGLLSSQYPWIIIFGLTLSAYLLSKTRLLTANTLRYLGVTLSWPSGAYRLMVGPSSNVSALLLAYGAEASNVGYFIVFVGSGVLVLIDFVRTLSRHEGKGPSSIIRLELSDPMNK